MARQMLADAAFLSVEACTAQVEAWTAQPPSGAGPAPVAPDTEHERLEALQRLDLGRRKKELDEAAREAAGAFGVPIGLVSLIDEEHQLMQGAAGLPPDLDAARRMPREASICGQVVAHEEVVVAEDVTEDPRFADNPLVLEKGIRFYAGAPLRTASGLVIGSLCIIDTNPRPFAEEERHRLQAMADALMARMELGGTPAAEASAPA
jgi:GAF domain-containing protein